MASKTVLITGCSAGGIGHQLAIEFASRSLHVFATARTLSKMSDLDNNPNITLLTLDVTSSSSIAAAAASVQAQTNGTLDYLVNNSGTNYGLPLLDVDLTTARALFDVNFWGVLATTQAFAPLLIAARGTVVNIASIVSMMHTPWAGIYSASKAAVDFYSETLRREVEPLGVRVVTVSTGIVKTKFFANAVVEPLPEKSVYKAAEKEIHAVAAGEHDFKKTPVEEYAGAVVSDVLAGKTGRIYRGYMATTVSWLPEWARDGLASMGQGLDKVKAGASGMAKDKSV